MKYVMNAEANRFVLIPDIGIMHSDIEDRGCIWTSAGFVSFTIVDGKLTATCFGESTSLKLKPGPEDAHIIACFMGLS